MHSTYEEIDAEWERLVAEAPGLPPECKAGVTAQMQHAAGLAIRARCVHCGGLLKATVLDLGHLARRASPRTLGDSDAFSRNHKTINQRRT